MASNVKHSTVLPLCAAAITALTTIATPALAQADNGCAAGYVPRNARPGDTVCVKRMRSTSLHRKSTAGRGGMLGAVGLTETTR
jgi:hypothetical protein